MGTVHPFTVARSTIAMLKVSPRNADTTMFVYELQVKFLTAQLAITGLAPILEFDSTPSGITLMYRGVNCVNRGVALAGTSM